MAFVSVPIVGEPHHRWKGFFFITSDSPDVMIVLSMQAPLFECFRSVPVMVLDWPECKFSWDKHVDAGMGLFVI